ncbi:MAG TPA: RHS repeat-associated core domain-containing protein [Rhabdochlamydiaceae bacterium]|nr:RHS repeat-associated core domain-containing protein [Rhabdochlamydiaceae bacterium]
MTWEAEPESIVRNVSIIQGNYAEAEIDAVIPGPDSLVVCRTYNSLNKISQTNLGGWQLFPYCYLSVQKDPSRGQYTTAEGIFEYTLIHALTDKGDPLRFAAWHNVTNPSVQSLFELDVESCPGLANTAKGEISAWTNQKNDKIYYHAGSQTINLHFPYGGQRRYEKTNLDGWFRLVQETLPSGNKLFYHYDDHNRLVLIEMKNSSEKKTFSWIKFAYGKEIVLTTSDQKIISYKFEDYGLNQPLLVEVNRSQKPTTHYQYDTIADSALLIRKEYPEGFFVQIDFDQQTSQVRSVSQPLDHSRMMSTSFDYFVDEEGRGHTEVRGPENRFNIYHYENYQLTGREDYLSGSLYRIHRKKWGQDNDFGNLLSCSIEDANQNVFYLKLFRYNEQGDLLSESEYGNFMGANETPLQLSEEGEPEPDQEVHTKSYFYQQKDQFYIVGVEDVKKSALLLLYKPGTNIVIGKIIREGNGSSGYIKKREFFTYDEDGVLVQASIDDGASINPKNLERVEKRYTTSITPRQTLPHFGAPEVIEEKYEDYSHGDNGVLIRKIVNHFDLRGCIKTQDIFDAEGKHRYSISKDYDENGLLAYETNAEGHTTTYTYDVYHNLKVENHRAQGIIYGYDYDFNHQCTHITQYGAKGECVQSFYSYDGNRNLISILDKNHQQSIFHYDDLGRLKSASYPPTVVDGNRVIQPIYTYEYDLFDNPIIITDPQQRVTQKTFTVRGQPTLIQYPDGTQELFKYDTEGSLHRHRSRDGTTRVIEYDYLGRVSHIQRYPRGSRVIEAESTNIYRGYDAFHLKSEENEEGFQTLYSYNKAGRLASRTTDDKKVDFIYDPLGRVNAIKRWKTDKAYSLEVKDLNFLGQVVEERTEDEKGVVLLKKKLTYDSAGLLKQIVGYPHNQESVLAHYDYDGLGRVTNVTNELGLSTHIIYEDGYINDLGQQVLKRTSIDPSGNQTEDIFDVYDRLALVLKKNSKGELLYQREVSYDLSGNRSLEQYARMPNEINPAVYAFRFKHEKGDLLTSFTQAEGSGSELITTFSYNQYADLTTQTFPKTKEPVTYNHQGMGYLSSLTFKDDNSSSFTKYEFDSNLRGYLTKENFLFNSVTYTYSANDRCSSETIMERSIGTAYKVTPSYDREGCITRIQLPDDSTIDYSYQGPLVIEITRRSKAKSELYKHKIVSYDLMGHVLEEILPFNGGSRKQSWDKLGRRTAILTDFFQDKVPENGYDTLSRLTRRTVLIGPNAAEATYTYTDLSQLASEKGSIDSGYTYDSLNNRLSKNNLIYKNNILNQLEMVGKQECKFDLNGNLIQWNDFTFEYNPLNQLIEAKDTQGNTITYVYTSGGKRLSKKIESKNKKTKTFRYFYLGDTELGCLDETGTIVELRIPQDPNDPERSTFVAFELKKNTYIPIYDLQGNVGCLINAKQRKIVESYEYSAFGEETILNDKWTILAASAVENPWRYLGKRTDSETGLIYFGQRYYDPSIGRWITPDPAGPIDGPNLYAFAHNNPLSWTDLFGLAAEMNASQDSEYLKYFKGEYESPCACEAHRTCKRGGDTRNAFGGIILGAVKYGVPILKGLAEQYSTLSMDDFYDRFSIEERIMIQEAIEKTWQDIEQSAEDWIVGTFDFDPTSKTSKNFQAGAYYGLSALDFFRPNLKNPRHFFSAPTRTVIESELRYTKSNLRLGQQVHKAYRANEVILRKKVKEYVLPSGKRIDFLDIENGKVYELKPNNPRSIKLGQQQLKNYVEELKTVPRLQGIDWETILETY